MGSRCEKICRLFIANINAVRRSALTQNGSIGLGPKITIRPQTVYRYFQSKPDVYIASEENRTGTCICVESDETGKGQQGAGDEQMNEKVR